MVQSFRLSGSCVRDRRKADAGEGFTPRLSFLGDNTWMGENFGFFRRLDEGFWSHSLSGVSLFSVETLIDFRLTEALSVDSIDFMESGPSSTVELTISKVSYCVGMIDCKYEIKTCVLWWDAMHDGWRSSPRKRWGNGQCSYNAILATHHLYKKRHQMIARVSSNRPFTFFLKCNYNKSSATFAPSTTDLLYYEFTSDHQLWMLPWEAKSGKLHWPAVQQRDGGSQGWRAPRIPPAKVYRLGF